MPSQVRVFVRTAPRMCRRRARASGCAFEAHTRTGAPVLKGREGGSCDRDRRPKGRDLRGSVHKSPARRRSRRDRPNQIAATHGNRATTPASRPQATASARASGWAGGIVFLPSVSVIARLAWRLASPKLASPGAVPISLRRRDPPDCRRAAGDGSLEIGSARLPPTYSQRQTDSFGAERVEGVGKAR